MIKIDIKENRTTSYEIYTIQDFINDLKQFNPTTEIINDIDIGWNSKEDEEWDISKKTTKYVAINYQGDIK